MLAAYRMSIIDEDSTLLTLSPVSGLEPVRVMVRVTVVVYGYGYGHGWGCDQWSWLKVKSG